jgi:gas vesicle protein
MASPYKQRVLFLRRLAAPGIAGAAVGAAVALLFAPASGEQTREYLGQRAREGRDRATEAAKQGRDLLNRQRDSITTAFERVREQKRPGPTPGPEGTDA